MARHHLFVKGWAQRLSGPYKADRGHTVRHLWPLTSNVHCSNGKLLPWLVRTCLVGASSTLPKLTPKVNEMSTVTNALYLQGTLRQEGNWLPSGTVVRTLRQRLFYRNFTGSHWLPLQLENMFPVKKYCTQYVSLKAHKGAFILPVSMYLLPQEAWRPFHKLVLQLSMSTPQKMWIFFFNLVHKTSIHTVWHNAGSTMF